MVLVTGKIRNRSQKSFKLYTEQYILRKRVIGSNIWEKGESAVNSNKETNPPGIIHPTSVSKKLKRE